MLAPPFPVALDQLDPDTQTVMVIHSDDRAPLQLVSQLGGGLPEGDETKMRAAWGIPTRPSLISYLLGGLLLRFLLFGTGRVRRTRRDDTDGPLLQVCLPFRLSLLELLEAFI